MIANAVLEKNIREYVKKYTEYVLRDLEFYKDLEGYKYKAVATFQKHFNVGAKNSANMLEASLADTINLVQSGSYYPKEMLIQYSNKDSKFIRTELKKLLTGKTNVYQRIDHFIDSTNSHFLQDKKQSYFDYRFLSFFLAAYQPEKYIHVKSKEFKLFAEMVEYDLTFSGTNGNRYETLFQFAELIRSVLKTSPEFKEVHKKITESFDYKDPSLSWGTFDFVFNVARRIDSRYIQHAKKAVRRNSVIHQNKIEELEDMLVDDDVVEAESGKSKEELLQLVRNFVPVGDGYVNKEGVFRVRRDNAIQKERIKILEDYSCQICGYSLEYTLENGSKRRFAHADHIIEKCDNGTEKADNIWILCANCHTEKTYGIIVVNIKDGKVYKNKKSIKLHHNNHLTWYCRDL